MEKNNYEKIGKEYEIKGALIACRMPWWKINRCLEGDNEVKTEARTKIGNLIDRCQRALELLND